MLACFLVAQRHLPAAAAAECVHRASPNCIRSAAQLACVRDFAARWSALHGSPAAPGMCI